MLRRCLDGRNVSFRRVRLPSRDSFGHPPPVIPVWGFDGMNRKEFKWGKWGDLDDTTNHIRPFYLRLGLLCLRLVFVTYGGLFCLRLKFGLVFLLTVEIRFDLFRLRWKIGLVFFTYGSPCPETWVWYFLLTLPPP